jgi:hydrogenase maturation protein HypF
VVIAHDLHPGYPSTEFARRASAEIEELSGATTLAVQHHHAHLASCLAEHGRERSAALGFVWDGTGFGPDGSVWGGELLAGDAAGFERVARLRPFRLLGGEAAVREPRRVALALAYEIADRSFDEATALLDAAGLEPFSVAEARTLRVLLEKGLRSPWTSSMGRLFDGVAALLGIDGGSRRSSFEGEIACRLESVADLDESSAGGALTARPFDLRPGSPPIELAPGQRPRSVLFEMDWRPFLAGLLAERRWGWSSSALSRAFHRGVADAAVNVALLAAAPRESAVALSGGCFQNRRLQREMVARLASVGFEVLTHRVVPANDGGIALGQLAVARARA